MLYELARAAVQRILQDKILLGLIVVGILAIFIGGFGGEHDREPTGPNPAVTASPAPGPQGQQQAERVDPALAADFIKWWLNSAMDFNAQTAQDSHGQAMGWMTPDAVQQFQAAFWSPQFAQGITGGTMLSSFTPTAVQAVAANPDGSVVVTVMGSWSVQQGPQPVVHQFNADFLVKRDQDGLRVAGLYNRTVAMAGGSVY